LKSDDRTRIKNLQIRKPKEKNKDEAEKEKKIM